MIPKVIHYCWFGGNPLPEGAKKCINSWKKFMPDYEIIEWNESNFDVNLNSYTKMCHENKKYAFLSDYVRLYVVEKYGGLYFDTDVEVIKSFDDLLCYDGFFGYEEKNYIATGLGFGAVKNSEILQLMMNEYNIFLNDHKELVSCPRLNTNACEQFGFVINGEYQEMKNVLLLPVDYLNPFNNNTGVLNKTKNTYSIHWYSMSWLSTSKRLRSKITRPLHRLFGDDLRKWFRKGQKEK